MKLLGFILILFFGDVSVAQTHVVVGTSAYPAVSEETSSCLALKKAGPNLAEKDIPSVHFSVPTLFFARADASRDLFITLIRITLHFSGNRYYVCEVGGDHLRALHSKWYEQKEAIIPAGTSAFVTDCALSCGGLLTHEPDFAARGLVEVFGVKRDVSGNETPEKMSTSIGVQGK